MKKIKIIILIFLTALLLITAKKDKIKYPKLVEDLIMPSGFNNEYVIKLKNSEPVEFYKPVVRIMDFDIPISFYKAIRDKEYNLFEVLKTKIPETNRYILLASDQDLESIYKEQKKVGNEDFEDLTDVELGNLKIASYVLNGKITKCSNSVKQEAGRFILTVSVGISITITNTNTGEIEYSKNINADNTDELFVTAEGLIIKGPRNLTDKPINSLNSTGDDIDLSPQYFSALETALNVIVFFIEEKYPIMGEVLEVKGDEIISTVSEKNGVKPGDFIFIIDIGEPIKNTSGKTLGFSKTMVGASQILTVEKELSTSKIIKLQDKKIKPKQRQIVISLPANAKWDWNF